MSKYDEAVKILEERFGRDTLISVATLDGGRPSVRIVNGYYKEGSFYSLTQASSGKMRQLAKNPEAAICGDWFSAHGMGENIGHLRDGKNAALMAEIRAAFSEWYGNGDINEDDPNMCILRIKLTDGILFSHGAKYIIDFIEKKA